MYNIYNNSNSEGNLLNNCYGNYIDRYDYSSEENIKLIKYIVALKA